MSNAEPIAAPKRTGQSGDTADAGEREERLDSRALLLNAAEHLFAQRGIEGVSLREIAVEAGQRNNSAVHYHFGDKQGLVDALLADRVQKLEAMRQKKIDEAGDLDRCDAETLLHFMWQPLVDIDAGSDGHWYIRFQLACHLQNMDAGHPLGSDPESYPASQTIMDALHRRYSNLALAHFHYRMGLVALMFWSGVCWHDKVSASTSMRWSMRFSLDETIKLAVAALGAPA